MLTWQGMRRERGTEVGRAKSDADYVQRYCSQHY